MCIPKTAEVTLWQTRGMGDEARLVVSTMAEAEHLVATSGSWNKTQDQKMNVYRIWERLQTGY